MVVLGKPSMILSCDTYATSATCSGTSDTNDHCDTCCNKLIERMFDCPPCRYFVLNALRQGSSCFCTVCFKQYRHRRRHYHQQQQKNMENPLEWEIPSRFIE